MFGLTKKKAKEEKHPLYNTRVVHNRTQGKYRVVIGDALVKMGDQWTPAVVYVSTENDDLPFFVRELNQFNEAFTEEKKHEATAA